MPSQINDIIILSVVFDAFVSFQTVIQLGTSFRNLNRSFQATPATFAYFNFLTELYHSWLMLQLVQIVSIIYLRLDRKCFWEILNPNIIDNRVCTPIPHLMACILLSFKLPCLLVSLRCCLRYSILSHTHIHRIDANEMESNPIL